MSYGLLDPSLHEAADQAKKYFADKYGATKFLCEQEVDPSLRLKPTWQATTPTGYRLCIDVRATPYSHTLNDFVTTCASGGIPIPLWVAVPKTEGGVHTKELQQAKALGIGVAEFSADSSYEFHRPVPLSLFAVRKTDFARLPKNRREAVKKAEDLFLDGLADQGCQQICQELEAVTRRFAQHSYDQKWWKKGAPATLKPKFFTIDSWANMLETLDQQIVEQKVQARSAGFKKAQIAGARQYTEHRNSVSHKPKSWKDLQARDQKLRTRYEATRDLLIEWFDVAKALKLPL